MSFNPIPEIIDGLPDIAGWEDQVSDGENGGVMMNEFPANYQRVWYEIGLEGVVGLNGTEYLELLTAEGFSEGDFEPVKPIHQHAIWKRVGAHPTPESVERAIAETRVSDHRFLMEGGSWTNNQYAIQSGAIAATGMMNGGAIVEAD
ncbi:MAG: hypothetical protein LAP85_07055 [Acidobacteriia bacterium]|nr:hypothetical protein [Terriglobia bacterium]